jgi:hypothetical protein
MKRVAVILCVSGIVLPSVTGQDRDQRIADLDRQLTEAKSSIATLQKTIESLSRDIESLRRPEKKPFEANTTEAKEAEGGQPDEAHEFADRIVGADHGSSERDNTWKAKPETFIQTRYSVAPIDGSGTAFEPNFRLSRIETRWAGKINDHLGAGLEIQFQESVEGSPERLVNDAFIEYYLTDHATIRVGQFIKPFGFDVQQSSVDRESPERGIFSGFFSPAKEIGVSCSSATSIPSLHPPLKIFSILSVHLTVIVFSTTTTVR